MKIIRGILNLALFGIFGTAIAFCAFAGTMNGLDAVPIVIGIFLTFFAVALWSLINTTAAERADMRKAAAHRRDAGGVAIIWWIFWLIAFFPALIIVAIVHIGRKNRATLREALK